MLPLKTRILQYAYEANKPITIDDVMRDLKPEYGGESQFNLKRVESYLNSYLGVGLMKADHVDYNDKGELVVFCVVGQTGKERMRFIPGTKAPGNAS